MTKAVLLEQLRLFTAEATKDLLLPVALQKEDQEQPRPRAARGIPDAFA